MTIDAILPDDYLTNYASWDEYMAYIWAAVLINRNLSPQGTVIEIAPGTSTKIGLALAKCQFKGNLYLVEPSARCLATIKTHYQTLLPNANIHTIQCDLVSSLAHLPFNPDCLITNHPLDDMLMAHGLIHEQQSELFDWNRNPSGEISSLFVARWQTLSQDSALLQTIKGEIFQQWLDCLKQIRPSTLIMNQYPSVALQKNHLQSLNLHAKDLLQHLKKTVESASAESQMQRVLNQFKNVDDLHIKSEILAAENWCLGNLRTT